MKKVFLAFAFVLVAQVGVAQDDAFKKDVMKLIELKEGDDDKGMDKMMRDIPKEKQAAFTAEMKAIMTSYREKIAVIAMEVYTKEDVKELLAFYGSPVHKKESVLAEKSKNVNVEFFTSLMPLIMKYQE
ncbi:MAG: hypothetical protein ACI7YS_02880 [Flavobacterium sp.]